MQPHGAPVGAHPAGREDLVPHGTCGAELGDAGELVRAHGQAELDAARGVVRVEAGLVQGAQVGGTGREGPSEFLCVRAAGVVHDGAVGDEEPQAGAVAGPVGGEAYGAGDVGGLAGAGGGAQRVDAQVGDDAPVGDPGVGVGGEQGVGGLRVGGARVQQDRGEVEVDVGEGLSEAVGGHSVGPRGDPQRADAVHEVVVHTAAQEARVGVGVPGPHVPPCGDVAAGAVSPGEGGRARETGVGGGRLRGVEGVDPEPVVGGGGQHRLRCVGEPLLGDTALAQHTRDEFPPPLGGGVGEPFGQVGGARCGGPVLREVHTPDGRESRSVSGPRGRRCRAAAGHRTAAGPLRPVSRHGPTRACAASHTRSVNGTGLSGIPHHAAGTASGWSHPTCRAGSWSLPGTEHGPSPVPPIRRRSAPGFSLHPARPGEEHKGVYSGQLQQFGIVEF